ncbi:tRNA pseudouridine(13) synthase TruD [Candidatus Micrarchaeota archaeon]|nr:tRNA pseudouridine(13) synthase TruD [Candidatus Micrarchaeota archaeon]
MVGEVYKKWCMIAMEPLSHISKTPGIGGTIKAEPEDFIVEEIGTDGIAFGVDVPAAKGVYVLLAEDAVVPVDQPPFSEAGVV